MDTSIYYNGNETLTHNRLFNFIIGSRGAGKTYWSKEWGIKDFLKNGKQWIYVRRYDTEFKKKDEFFKDILKKFPNHEFKVDGYEAKIDGKTAGYFLSLSKSKIEKSTSFPNVNKIIFDEFILDKGNYHYIHDEVTNFLELYSTVARDRRVIVFFLSNAITITNPYFLYFNMQVDGKKRYYKNKTGILIEFIKNKEFQEHMKKTEFAKMLEGTRYYKYAIENKMLRDTDTFIKHKTEKAKHYFVIKYKTYIFGVWIDRTNGYYYISKKYDKLCKLIFVFTQNDHEEGTLYINKSKRLKHLLSSYEIGKVFYESVNIKNLIFEIFRMFIR